MRKLLFLIPVIVAMLLIVSCCKSDIAKHVPSCIRNEIKTIKDDPHAMITQVDEYLFQGQLVYGFSSNRIADASMEIKDGGCKTLCHVGGFGGPGIAMCNGVNFFQHAVLKRNIWTK